MHWTSKQETGKNPEKNFETITDQIKKRQKIVKGRKLCVSLILKFLQDTKCYFKNLHIFYFQETTYIYFPSRKYSMYRCNNAFDKNVKKRMWMPKLL